MNGCAYKFVKYVQQSRNAVQLRLFSHELVKLTILLINALMIMPLECTVTTIPTAITRIPFLILKITDAMIRIPFLIPLIKVKQ